MKVTTQNLLYIKYLKVISFCTENTNYVYPIGLVDDIPVLGGEVVIKEGMYIYSEKLYFLS